MSGEWWGEEWGEERERERDGRGMGEGEGWDGMAVGWLSLSLSVTQISGLG